MRHTTAACILLVVILLAGGETARAQDALRLRMSLSYHGATAAQVLEALAGVLNCRLQLDKNVTGSVTLEVRNVTAETVLRAVCESVGCRWRIQGGQLVVDDDPEARAKAQADISSRVRLDDVHQEIPAEIVWSDAPLDGALRTIAGMLDAELRLDQSLSRRRISLNQNRASAWAALTAICRQAGCLWRTANEPRRLLVVVPVDATELAAELPSGVPRVGDPGVTAPKLVHRARPRYPETAKQANIQGRVTVECLVQADGAVSQVRVVRSLDKVHGIDAEAVMAAKLHVFAPGTRDGRPIPVIVQLDFTLTLR